MKSPHLDRFLRAVHRRWVVVRVAETAGTCVLGACGLLLIVLPILLWRGELAMPIVLTALSLAAALGLLAGMMRRPSRMSSAAEADGQLQLADLLSTALFLRDRAPIDPWAATVVSTADARCRALSSNDVILNRLGARTWGGIGLATALVLTLGLMSARPQPSIAVATAVRDRAIAHDAAQNSAGETFTHDAARTDAHSRTIRNRADRPVDVDGHEVDPRVGENGSAAQAASSSQGDAAGAGMSTSAQNPNVSPPTREGSTGRRADDLDGIRSSGGQAARITDQADGQTSGGAVAADRGDAPSAAPWERSTWSSARDQAFSAVREGRVPDAYREMVRGYFDAEQSE